MTTPTEFGNVPLPPNGESPVWEPAPVDPEPLSEVEDSEDSEPVYTPAGPAPRSSSSVTRLLIVSAVIALVGVAFAVGRVTATGAAGTGLSTTNGLGGAPNGAPAIGANASGVPGVFPGGRDGGFEGRAGTVTGTVVSSTANSITIQLAGGQTETVATGSSTTYNTTTPASSSAVVAGATVTIQTSGPGAVTGSAPAAGASPETAATRVATAVTITGK